MWVCDVCGMEVDDAFQRCPFGCGPRSEASPGMSFPDTLNARHSQGSTLVLTEGKTGSRIEIDQPMCILGREGDCRPGLFTDEVSRKHLKISCEDGVWKARHLSMVNPSILVTSTGRIPMEHEIDYPLHDGDRLRLANQTFAVGIVEKAPDEEQPAASSYDHLQRISQERSETQVDNENNERSENNDELECWCITCPCCGSKYRVENASSRIAVCQTCKDPLDQREIKRVVPVFGVLKREEFIDAR